MHVRARYRPSTEGVAVQTRSAHGRAPAAGAREHRLLPDVGTAGHSTPAGPVTGPAKRNDRFGTRVAHEPAPVDAALVGRHLPGWDYADAWELPSDTQGARAGDVAAVLLRSTRAGRIALAARDLAMRPFGVAPVGVREGDLFPVLHDAPELVVLGLDDRHLDFRILVQVEPGIVRCTTAVRRRNALGRLYFAVVGIFHRQLVPHLLSRYHHATTAVSG